MIHRIVGATIVGLFIVSTLLLGACQLGRGGQSPPASKTYLLTLRTDDFIVLEHPVTTRASADYKVDITAADVTDAVIVAHLQHTEPQSEGTWESFPYTIHGFVPGSDPKRPASLTLSYQVQKGSVQILATASLTGPEALLSLSLLNGVKVRIRVVPTRAQ